jgi:alkylation response protein AidB-like acyl-CoA dehydrogenase
MELELTVDQELFADTTRKFLDDKAGVEVVRELRGDERGYDETYWRQGCELGWTSLLVAEDDGGGSVSGDGVRDLALVAYQFGHHAAPGPLIGCNVVAAVLSRSGSGRQKDEVLGAILAGEAVAAWAVAEPRPHDGLGEVALDASPRGDGWSLAGTKVQVESAAMASHVLVTARAPTGPTQFLVPTGAPGVTVRPMQSVDLTRRFSSVSFDDAEVGADAVVGEVGGAEADLARQFQLANVMQCAEMVGVLDAAMDMTLEWVMDRYSFGRPLGSYQAIKHRLADMKTWLEASHAIADGAALAVQRDAADADELCSGAKAYIGHHGPELCQECVQFHGGIGVTFDHDLHLYLRRVVLDATTYGTVTDHRLRLTDILEARESEASQGAA